MTDERRHRTPRMGAMGHQFNFFLLPLEWSLLDDALVGEPEFIAVPPRQRSPELAPFKTVVEAAVSASGWEAFAVPAQRASEITWRWAEPLNQHVLNIDGPLLACTLCPWDRERLARGHISLGDSQSDDPQLVAWFQRVAERLKKHLQRRDDAGEYWIGPKAAEWTTSEHPQIAGGGCYLTSQPDV